MGVVCTAMTYVGKYVDDAEQYLLEKGLVTKEQIMVADGDTEYLMGISKCALSVQTVSYYSDEGYYVGFEVDPSDYKTFDALIEKFKEITGDDADVESFEHWW